MDWIYLFTSFNGRISRLPFWIAFAALALLDIATQSLAARVQGDTLATILDLALTYPEFAVAVKRANDRNMSPWVVALFFAFNAALDLFVLMTGNFDADNPINPLIAYPVGLLILILLIELGFRRGTEGPNRFGSDPLSGDTPTLLSRYSFVRWLTRWIETLTPNEPFILGGEGPPNYPEELPRSVKQWCFTITAVNAVIFAIASFVLRSFGPALAFVLITMAGPITMMLSWKRTTKHLNRHANMLQAMSPFSVNLSLQWCAIFALLGTPFFMIVSIFAMSPH